MSGRFEGAITTQEDEPLDSSIPPEPERPPRPVLVELGSAILIVGGITAIMGGLVSLAFGSELPASAGLLPIIVVALNVITIVTGVWVRSGRYWRICINIVAIAMFLYLTAFPNPIAMFYLALDTVVFFALMRYRHWFDWKPPTRSTSSTTAA